MRAWSGGGDYPRGSIWRAGMIATMDRVPAIWAAVWAIRLSASADDPNCRSQFLKSLESIRDPLRELVPAELLDLIEKTAAADSANELRRLVPTLRELSRPKES